MASSRDKQQAGFLIGALTHSGAKREGGLHQPPCAVKDGEMASAGEG